MASLRIAVVIPLYNKGPFVKRALRSVLRQTRLPDEVIVVDDGSTDGGPDMVMSMGSPLVRLVSQANAGVSAARNRGVAETNADMVAFLDADDEWYPEFLARLADVAIQFRDAVAVFANFLDRRTGRPYLTLVPQAAARLDDYFRFCLQNRGRGMWTGATLIRRDVLVRVGGFPQGVSLGEDLDTWARLAWSGAVVVVPEVLAVYHADADGSLTRATTSLDPPPLLDTYQRWRSEGRIPPHLVAPSLDLARLQQRWYVNRLLLRGQSSVAKSVLLHDCRPLPHMQEYVKLWVFAMLPARTYARVRSLLRHMRHRVRLVVGGPARSSELGDTRHPR